MANKTMYAETGYMLPNGKEFTTDINIALDEWVNHSYKLEDIQNATINELKYVIEHLLSGVISNSSRLNVVHRLQRFVYSQEN